MARELGIHGVLAAEGEEWPRQRQVTMQAFKPDYLRRFFPEMRKITDLLNIRWSKMAESGQSIDVQKDWVRFTVDITTNLAFGYDINLLEEEGDDFQQHLEKLLPVFNRRANAPFPYWHFFKLPCDLAMEKSLAVIKEKIHVFVQQTRQRLEQQPEVAGPRFCPGRNLAMIEIKMAMLCRNFSITRVETGVPVQEVFSFTMMPDKVMVKFEAR